MGMVAFKFFAFVALILVLSTKTATCEPTMYMIEEVALVDPKAKMVNTGNPKLKMMIMQVTDQNKPASVAGTTPTSLTQSILSCADEGDYCNTLFGKNCCPGIDCVQAPLGGGICHKW